jgi:hypothetical protein
MQIRDNIFLSGQINYTIRSSFEQTMYLVVFTTFLYYTCMDDINLLEPYKYGVVQSI